jgi:ABC-type transport system substrate-binding protein
MEILVAEGLVEYDERCNAVPDVAESWKTSPDASEYTFIVRKGVMFHNGCELTAEEVKKSCEHVIDPKTFSSQRRFQDREKESQP